MFAFSPQLVCEQSLPHERHLWDMIGIRVRASCCAYIIERQHASQATGLVRAHLRVGTPPQHWKTGARAMNDRTVILEHELTGMPEMALMPMFREQVCLNYLHR